MLTRLRILVFLLLGINYVNLGQGIDSARWIQGISVGPTYEFRHVQLKSGQASTPQDAYQVSSEKAKAGFLLLYTVDIRLGPKGFYLFTGLGYENKGYQSKESDTLFNTGSSNNGSQMYTYAAYTANKELYRYHTLDIPLGLTYKHGHHKIVYSISAGLMFDSPLFYTKIVRYTPTSSYVTQQYPMVNGTEKDRTHEPGNMDLLVNLSIGIHVQKNMVLSVRPGFSEQLYSHDLTTITSHHYSYRLYSFTCPVSLIWDASHHWKHSDDQRYRNN